MSVGYPSLPTALTRSIEETARALQNAAKVINGVLQGKTNNTGTLTLTANAATTTFQHPLLGAASDVSFSPLTANAAAELGNGTMFVLAANKGKQTWTVTHANNAQVDRTFSFSITG